MLRLILVTLFTLMLYAFAGAVGESAVITLEFPTGAENTGMGECGVSLDNSMYCAFYNPASAASFAKKNDLQFAYSRFYEPILPAFGIPDLWHTDTTFGVFLPNMIPHVDIGYMHFVNFLNFGENAWTDSLGNELGRANSDEKVTANTISLTAFDMISVGASYKRFDSRLAPGYGPNGQGTAQGRNYDLGVRMHKKFTLWDIINLEPAFGISWQTLGQKTVYYIEPSEADPLPRKLLYGISTTVDLFGLFAYTGAFEVDRQDFDVSFTITDTATGLDRDTSYHAHERMTHEGHRFATPFYAWYFGYLTDYSGKRQERTSGTTIMFNYRTLLNGSIAVVNLFNKDMAGRIRNFDRSLLNGWLRPNIYIAKSESNISEIDDDPDKVREGQKRKDLTWGISVIGVPEQFLSRFKKGK